MIRVVVPKSPLTAGERYGLDLLVDLSRLIPVSDESVEPSEGASRPGSATGEVTVRVTGDAIPGGTSTHTSRVSQLERGLEVNDGEVIVPRELLRVVVDVAGAGHEQRSAMQDRYGRVPSLDNPMVAAARERSPLVSEAAAGLRSLVTRVAGRRPVFCVAPWPNGRRWCAALSHDLDVVSAWPVFSAARVAELLRKRQVGRAGQVMSAALRSLASDPVWSGVRGVLDADRGAGITATWFVLCGTPTPATFRQGDLVYSPESRRVRRIVDAVRSDGHEIGLHGSFATMDAFGVFTLQRSRLAALSGQQVVGVRQHFLRMRPGETQREMARSGFVYDATYGFPDRNGFRLGVADAVIGWDNKMERESGLWEIPLTWMDRAQSKYQSIEDPARWVDEALELAAVCRQLEGIWVGLWHPNLTDSLGYPAAPAAYSHLVTEISAKQPFTASLDRIVAWRRLRRSVRLHRTPDGALSVSGLPSPSRDFDIEIEDGAGRPLIRLARDSEDRVPVPQ